MNGQSFIARIGVGSPTPPTVFEAGGQPRLPRPFWRQAGQTLLVTAAALTSYLVFSQFFVQSVCVTGMSMAPTLRDSGRYLLNRWVYFIQEPKRGDIVVLRDPADHGLSVKRVIAAAGDSVVLKEGQVFVNGRQLDEPYLGPGVLTFPETQAREQRLDCGEGQYVVFGDNRGNSADSRCYGPISRGGILGRVVR
jgi:signal peptidase I